MESPVDSPPVSNASSRLFVWRRWFPILLCAFILGYGTLNALSPKLSQGGELDSLSKAERAAMSWVAASTSPASRFLMLPDNEWNGWWVNKTSEWFPVLAERTSVATVQGYEWLPDGAFATRRNNFKLLQKCAGSVASCLDNWSRQTDIPFTHVYIQQPFLPAEDAYRQCCQRLIDTLKSDPQYELVYSGPGALVFAKR